MVTNKRIQSGIVNQRINITITYCMRHTVRCMWADVSFCITGRALQGVEVHAVLNLLALVPFHGMVEIFPTWSTWIFYKM